MSLSFVGQGQQKMARQKNPNAGTVFGDYTSYVDNTISRLRLYALDSVPCNVSYQDLWDMMYPAEAQPVLKEWLPKLGRRVCYVSDMVFNGAQQYASIHVAIDVHNGVVRPEMAPPDMWDGPRKQEVINTLRNIVIHKHKVSHQWDMVSRTFHYLNSNARTMNKMFSLWPAIKQLCELAGMDAHVAQMGLYKYYAPPPMTAVQFSELRDSIPVVGVAMIAQAHANDERPIRPVVVTV